MSTAAGLSIFIENELDASVFAAQHITYQAPVWLAYAVSDSRVQQM